MLLFCGYPASCAPLIAACTCLAPELVSDQISCREDPICADKVVVYKYPGLHNGDPHVLEAVNPEGLLEIIRKARYGIFFSTKGPRSLVDEIANSDFDGEILNHFQPSPPWEAPEATKETPKQAPSDPGEFESLHWERAANDTFKPK